MKNVSSKFLKSINDVRNWQYTVTLDFAQGDYAGQRRTLHNEDLAMSGCEISMSAETSSLPLGNAIGKTLALAIMNNDDRWSEYDFFGCEIKVEINYTVEEDVTNIVLGYFTVIEPETYGSTIEITAVDKMFMLDTEFTKGTITTPCSLNELIREACRQSNIEYSNNSFPNQNYMISVIPDEKTCRDIVGLCAMIGGGNAVIDDTGRVNIVYYSMNSLYNEQTNLNGGTFDTNTTPYSDGDTVDGGDFTYSDTEVISGGSFNDLRNYHVLYKGSKITITTDDVIITGVETTIDKTTYSAGRDGYKIGFSNELLEGNTAGAIQDAVNKIGEALIWRYEDGDYKGLKYRPFEIDHVSLPIVDFADPCYVVDRRQREYMSFITDYTFKFKGHTTIKCTSESPLRNTSKYTGTETQAIIVAKQLVEAEKTARELAIQTVQKEIENAGGLYQTKVNYLPNLPVTSGRNLKITFDAQCQTEANIDSVYLYVKYEGDTDYKAVFERKSGNSGTWTPIVIPYEKKITAMQIYWYTDASVTYWGWKITKIELTNDAVTVTPFTPQMYHVVSQATQTINATSISMLESEHPYINNLRTLYQVDVSILPNVGSIYVLHNKPEMNESDIWWVATSDVMYVSTDKGQTFNASVDASGNAIVKHLSAVGIDADWINTGTISVGGYGTQAKLEFKDASNRVIGGLTASLPVPSNPTARFSPLWISDGVDEGGYSGESRDAIMIHGDEIEFGSVKNGNISTFVNSGMLFRKGDIIVTRKDGVYSSDEQMGAVSGYAISGEISVMMDSSNYATLSFVNGLLVGTTPLGGYWPNLSYYRKRTDYTG